MPGLSCLYIKEYRYIAKDNNMLSLNFKLPLWLAKLIKYRYYSTLYGFYNILGGGD